MPELPDVEVYRRRLQATSLHKKIGRVEVPGKRVVQGTSAAGLGKRLNGRKLTGARRHGKYLFAPLEGDGCLVMHFGMTGDLRHCPEGAELPDYTAVTILFAGGDRLAYISRRKLGRMTVADDMDEFVEEHDLGPDADTLSAKQFRELLADKRGSIKGALMDQETLAGLGNIYSDEILFHAGLHPQTRVERLDDEDFRRLHGVMKRVINTAVKHKADPTKMPSGWLLPRRDEGEHCPRCEGSLKRISASGRSAYICPRCQKKK